jgi:hypothetical protein
MTITLDIQPEIEKGLLAQATARGVSLADYLQEIVAREAYVASDPAPQQATGQQLVDACAKVRGLLTDEEVDALFSRNPSVGRPVNFE